MTTPLQSFLDHTRATQLLLTETISAYGSRVAGWCVAGNAAALGITYSAVLAGTQCSQRTIADLTGPFVFGLIFSGVGAVVSYIASNFGLMEIARIGVALETLVYAEDNRNRWTSGVGELDSELQAKSEEVGRQMGRSWRLSASIASAVAALLLLSASGIQFCIGVLGPTVLRTTDYQSCARPSYDALGLDVGGTAREISR